MTDSLGLEVGPGPVPGAGHRGPAGPGRRRRRCGPGRRGGGRAWPTCSTGCSVRGRAGGSPTTSWPTGSTPASRRHRAGRPAAASGRASPRASTSAWPRRRRRCAAGGARRRRPPGRRPAVGVRPGHRHAAGPGHRSGRPAGRPPAPGRAGGRRRRAVGASGPGATGCCWPPATWPRTSPAWPCSATDEVAWVEDGSRPPSLRVSPIDVGPVLAERLWGQVTGVLTSATVPIGLAERLGMPAGRHRRPSTWAVRSTTAPTRCCTWPRSLPDRRSPEAEPAMHDELEVLINAAGGRTLALFTSWRAMRAAVEALADRLDVPGPDPVRPAQAGPGRGVPGRRVRLPVRHPRVLAGGRRARAHPQPGHHRPHPLPPPRRPGARGPPGAGRRRRLRRRRPAPGRDPAGPGGRPPDPLVAPTAGWWPCSTAGWPRPATAARCWSGCRPMKRTLDRDEVVAFLADIAAG